MLRSIPLISLVTAIAAAVNVGTALYDINDATYKAWTEDDAAMLRSRMMMDHLIPETVVAGRTFLDYAKVVIRTTEMIVSDQTRKIVMVSVADAIGGYLQGVMLPHVRAAYYNGREHFKVTDELHNMAQKMKFILETDGRGWLTPEAAGPPNATTTENDDIVEETENPCAALLVNGGGPDTVVLPAFDDDLRPGSMAFPFAVGKRLFDVNRPWTADDDRRPLLVRYYRLAAGCTSAAPHRFRVDFNRWLNRVVVPLLADSRQWYPVLASASRVVRAAAKAAVVETAVETTAASGRHKRKAANSTATASDDDDDDLRSCGDRVPNKKLLSVVMLVSLWFTWLAFWAFFISEGLSRPFSKSGIPDMYI